MTHTLTYLITEADSGIRIDDFLKRKGYSKNLLIRLRRTESGITLNGLPAFTIHILTAGDILVTKLADKQGSEKILPTAIPLEIIFEDEHLMVINKAAGVPIHPSQGNYEGTLANGLAYYFKEQGIPFVYRVINRLDRDTTGLLIVAKHGLSACILSAMVRERQIFRTYLAVVSGRIKPGDQGVITAPIARTGDSTIERQVDFEHGEYARTEYLSLRYDAVIDCTLVRLTLETGRTHQIRVHMKYLGYPLLGDFLYHPDYRFIKRQSLHSRHLAFAHPITGEKLSFTAPVPDDFPLTDEL